jgi:hypothetical protein
MNFKPSTYLNGIHGALVSYLLEIAGSAGVCLYVRNAVALDLKYFGTGLLA